MAYRLSLEVEQDLEAIFEYGLEEFGFKAADASSRHLVRAFETLASMPRMGRERDEVQPELRSMPIGVHIILYRIVGADIRILRVRHAREDWQSERDD